MNVPAKAKVEAVTTEFPASHPFPDQYAVYSVDSAPPVSHLFPGEARSLFPSFLPGKGSI